MEKSIEKNPLAAAKAKGNNKKGQKPSLLPNHEKPNTKENIDGKPTFAGSTNNPKVPQNSIRLCV